MERGFSITQWEPWRYMLQEGCTLWLHAGSEILVLNNACMSHSLIPCGAFGLQRGVAAERRLVEWTQGHVHDSGSIVISLSCLLQGVRYTGGRMLGGLPDWASCQPWQSSAVKVESSQDQVILCANLSQQTRNMQGACSSWTEHSHREPHCKELYSTAGWHVHSVR